MDALLDPEVLGNITLVVVVLSTTALVDLFLSRRRRK